MYVYNYDHIVLKKKKKSQESFKVLKTIVYLQYHYVYQGHCLPGVYSMKHAAKTSFLSTFSVFAASLTSNILTIQLGIKRQIQH